MQQDNRIDIQSYQELLMIIKNHHSSLEKSLICLSFESLCSLGVGVAWGYLSVLQEKHPEWAPYFAVDCGDYVGYVLSSLRHGIKNIFYKGPHEQRLRQVVQAYGGTLRSI